MAVSTIDALYNGTSEKLTTSATGITVTGNATFADNGKAIFGAGSDLQIYHDGSNSYIKNNTGVMRIHGTQVQIKDEDNNETLAVFNPQGSVDLYYDNNKKLATTSTGVDITGVMTANGTVNSAQAEFGTSSNRPLIIQSSNVGGYADDLTEFHKNSGVGQFSFSNTGGEMMRIDSSGKMMVGTTSASGKVTIENGGNTTGLQIFQTNTSINYLPLGIHNDRVAGGSTAPMVQFQAANGADVGSIDSNVNGTSYTTTSDYRLKENVVDLTGASARVNQLDVKRFNFIADETNTLVDGFLAHEVATVVPEAITGTKDAMRDEEYEVTPAVLDDDGNVTTEAVMGTRSVPDYQGIDQSKLVPLLTAALQEALTEIASLKTRVEALEA